MRAIAVIPAKGASQRVPDKNFREFHGGRSLLEIKIEQCKASGQFSEVYVSSDSPLAEGFAGACGASFIPRDERLCRDDAPWADVLTGVLESLPENDAVLIAWTPVTSPLFSRYADALRYLSASGGDSLMSVTRLQHYLLNHDFIPVNFQYGVWASYSQKLRPFYQMNCALWLATKQKMLQNRFQIGDRPAYFELSLVEGLDIDTPEEFEVAQLLFAARAAGDQREQHR